MMVKQVIVHICTKHKLAHDLCACVCVCVRARAACISLCMLSWVSASLCRPVGERGYLQPNTQKLTAFINEACSETEIMMGTFYMFVNKANPVYYFSS